MNHTATPHKLTNWIKKIKVPLQATFNYLRTFYEKGNLPRIDRLANSRLGKALEKSRWHKIWQSIHTVVEFGLRHWIENGVKGRIGDFKTVVAFWKRGWLGRVELLTIAIGVVTVPTILILGSSNKTGNLSIAVLVISLVLFALAYAFAYAATYYLSLFFFTLISIYLVWYGFIIGGSLYKSPLFALPSLWLLFIGWLKAFTTPKRWNYLWLAVLCIVTSHLTYGAFGIYAHFKDTAPDWLLQFVLALIYYALTALPLYLRRKQISHFKPGAVFIFWGTLLVMGIFFILAGIKDIQITADNTLLSLRNLLGVVDIFWMCLGATMVESTLKVGNWWTHESVNLLTKKLLHWLIPLGWLISAVLGWMMTFTAISSELAFFVYKTGLQTWINTWPDSIFFAVQNQVYVGLAALVLTGISLLLHRFSDDFLALLNSVWIAIFVGQIGVFDKFLKFSSTQSAAPPSSDWWLILVLIWGLVWEMAKAGESYWKKEEPGRHYAMVAFLGFMLSISAVTLGSGLSEVANEYHFYSLNGIIFLGWPMMVYLIMLKGGYQSMGRARLIGLVAIGALSAVIPLCINPMGDWSMWLAPLAWVLVLGIWGKPLARYANLFDACLAGGALSVGFVTFWMSPEVIPVPFLSVVQDYQNSYLMVDLQRPFLEAGQIGLSLAALGVGIGVGLLTYFGHRYFAIATLRMGNGEKNIS